jgi:hypothetical protein
MTKTVNPMTIHIGYTITDDYGSRDGGGGDNDSDGVGEDDEDNGDSESVDGAGDASESDDASEVKSDVGEAYLPCRVITYPSSMLQVEEKNGVTQWLQLGYTGYEAGPNICPLK